MAGELILYFAIGFAAQLIDGSIGMGYGVIATSALLASGLPPATASAAVHVTKIPTGIASGVSHWRVGNLDWRLARKLILPGIVGGLIGATMVSLTPASAMRPLIALYLMVMGGVIMVRILKPPHRDATKRSVLPVGFLGGLFDSAGGGWGAVVNSTLLMRGFRPSVAVAATSAVEPIVAGAQAAVFGFWLGAGVLGQSGVIALALIAGAVCAAPVAALLVRRLPVRPILFVVGVVLFAINGPIVYAAIATWR